MSSVQHVEDEHHFIFDCPMHSQSEPNTQVFFSELLLCLTHSFSDNTAYVEKTAPNEISCCTCIWFTKGLSLGAVTVQKTVY